MFLILQRNCQRATLKIKRNNRHIRIHINQFRKWNSHCPSPVSVKLNSTDKRTGGPSYWKNGARRFI